MVIKGTFRVWKVRFAILANMSMYKIDTQTDIVLTTMAIHNYIRKSNMEDNAFQTVKSKIYISENSTSSQNNGVERLIEMLMTLCSLHCMILLLLIFTVEHECYNFFTYLVCFY